MQPVAGPALAGIVVERVLADVRGTEPGPLVIGIGGVHGNEPAGVHALRNVAASLAAGHPPLRGRFVALAGNRAALAAGVRYLGSDLNRLWADPAPADAVLPEDVERAELERAIDGILAEEPEGVPTLLVDLHTTSGRGPAFTGFVETDENRGLGFSLPLPAILGLAERIRGTMLEHFARVRRPGIVIEGGTHADPRVVQDLESAMWLLLEGRGCVDAAHVPDLAAHHRRLEEVGRGLPRAVRVVHRHHINPGDDFRMEPGFRSFQRVEKGLLLAYDVVGPVHATLDGWLLMPLYQGLGEDGFFLAVEEPTSTAPRG